MAHRERVEDLEICLDDHRAESRHQRTRPARDLERLRAPEDPSSARTLRQIVADFLKAAIGL
jgi:hypothetical protein